MKYLLLLTVVAAGACQARQAPVPEATIDAEAMMRHVRALAHDSMEGRRMNTPGSARARAYITTTLREASLEQVGGSWELPFEEVRADGSRRAGVNLAALVRGTSQPSRYIVVTAHYDHLGYGRAVNGDSLYNGADDNASGTGAVIELARYFRAHPPRHSMLFVLLDGEEGGLTGARMFVQRPPVPLEHIAVNVNLDMVGRNAANELWAAGAHHTPALRPLLDSATGAGITLRQGHDRPGVAGQDDWTMQSDHAAFHRAGIPFIYFGEEDHPDYHRPSDHAEGLMPAFYAGAATTILRTLQLLDRNLQNLPSR